MYEVCEWQQIWHTATCDCLINRQQRIHIDGSLSCPQDLHFGVPQGSVLGPFLFCLYTTSISQMINTHDDSHHMYADDTQVYIELSQSDTHTVFCPGLKKGMVLLEEKGHFCSRNYILRALSRA